MQKKSYDESQEWFIQSQFWPQENVDSMYFSVSSSLDNRKLDLKKSDIEKRGEDSCNANILCHF